MAIELERIGDGEYYVTLGNRRVKIERGLRRKWKVKAVEGLEFPEKPAKSYSAAKTIAEDLLGSPPPAGGSREPTRQQLDLSDVMEAIRKTGGGTPPDVPSRADFERLQKDIADLKRRLERTAGAKKATRGK